MKKQKHTETVLYLKHMSHQATRILCRIYYCCNLMQPNRNAIWNEFERTYAEIYHETLNPKQP